MITPTGQALKVALDGRFHALKENWRTNVTAEDVVRDPSQPMAEAREWALEKLKALAARNFAVAGFPNHPGTVAESIAHFEMLALGDLSLNIKSGVQHGLFGGAITNLGNSWHHETFIDGVIDCSITGCFAMTELGHGSDVQSVETTITYVPETDEYEVHSPTPTARKAYIGNAGLHGKMAVVFGQLIVAGENQGVHAILMDIRDDDLRDLPGVETGDQGHKGGLLGVDNGTILFDHVRVPRRMLLNRYGGVNDEGVYESRIESKNARFFTMLGTLVRGRICVGSGAAMATRKALTIATRYALQRTQFRRPGLGEEIALLEYQTHQRKLMPNIARAYAYGFAVNEVADQLQRVHDAQGSDPTAARELETRAAGLKATLTRWTNDTLQVCREACGGAGYMSGNGLTMLRQDADVFATFEGDNTVLMQLVAKALLLDYKRTWGEMDLVGTAQAGAKLLGDRFMERTTAGSTISRLISNASLKPEARQLRARGWQIEMLEFRERHVVAALARRMREAGKADGEAAFQAVNACQEHMLEAARAHTDRVILEAFVAGISSVTDEYVRSLLIKVCDLYALGVIEANRAWFMEHNGFDGGRSKAISAAVDDLCRELSDKALELVEGLGVPEEWLNSEMLRPEPQPVHDRAPVTRVSAA
ncbi:acyl-CoA dehydrogenase family protein [Tessaracoccus sp. OS52]|uniref:acyl-CoA dehydrogenase family protein n=1 Tax=Tessaracoccus sp. OS52 TaxID=2886691 RepID=UPI001D122527|nr:acyl-CoA dehydrogenase [Tessaracoccus sp. OS52]MCC2593504.1 acyl-CoA dehydrogenase family protein [Tessaracoccus sp. OS52]